MRIFLLISFSFLSAAAFAQPKINADKIIGVVGNKIILKSDIENSLIDMQRQGMELPPNAKCLTLEQAMGIKALVLQAEKDSLPVTDEDVEGDLDLRIRNYISQYGKDEVERMAGKSIYQLKEDMKEGIRDQKLAGAMRNKIVDDIRITPYEVKAFYDKIPTDSLPYYETELEIGQLVIYPKASRDAEEYAQEQLADYKKQIESGKIDFKTAAARYSDEPGAKERFGQMEINRNQKDIDPTFLAKCFTLKEGQISNPFKSKFGYHIIKLISRAGDDVVVQHIIKIPQVTTVEMKAGFENLDTVRAKLVAGTMDFGTAINRYTDDLETKFTGGMKQGSNGTFLTIDQLDKDIIPILNELKVGGYSQPQEFDDNGKRAIRILYLKSKTQPHRENMKDDYSKISQRALEEKKENALEKWFNTKIGSYYIMVDPEYKDCDVMQKWIAAASVKK
jgi:peptidyl-prolyl cis-trans isomerase SurA